MRIKNFLVFLLLISLTACAPKFEIESKYNEFRNTYSCKMYNNTVKKHNVGGLLFFNLAKDTELSQKKLYTSPYFLQIENRQGFIRFKDDSHLRLTLINSDGKAQNYLLRGTVADCQQTTSTHYYPGYFTNYTYIPGHISTNIDDRAYVYFNLTIDQLNKILNACSICFELETIDQTVKAALSDDNIRNIQEFKNNCKDIKANPQKFVQEYCKTKSSASTW